MLINFQYIEITKTIVNRQNRVKLISGFVISAIGAMLFAFNSEGYLSLFRIVGLAMTLFGAALIIRAYRSRKADNHKLYKVFKNRLKRIVWVHHHITTVMPFGIHLFERYTLFVYLLNGKTLTLIGKKSEVLTILKELESLCSHATFGYSIKKEQLYKANPALLLQDD